MENLKTKEETLECYTRKNEEVSNKYGMKFKYIKPGAFIMGSPEDEPGKNADEIQHQVTISASYYIQTTVVTQGQWRAVTGINPSWFNKCGDDCPVEKIFWDDV